ncbi:hypothetical protein CK556_00540 [Mesoplasma chauliocola]|uniref:Uncharacterized protein n=1 Tax=Mesoplasma chauliocola TaxID=216427 RepID=A0A249SMD9_9MOLU|nr:hypothetical protein [Mesoplasma chauliocola]ASZ08854.1 hypothetical protein CK556_00540 [Mesoplasma chauliocola]
MAKNELKNLKKLRKEGLDKHYENVNKELNSDIYAAENYTKLKNWRENKKLSWYSWIAIIGVTLLGIGLSFGLGYALKDSASATGQIESDFMKATAFVATGYLFLLILIIFIINYIRNKKAINHFNDKRLRYQKTYSKEEAIILKWRNTITLSLMLIIIFTIVMYCI